MKLITLILVIFMSGCAGIQKPGMKSDELTVQLQRFENGCRFVAKLKKFSDWEFLTECPTNMR